MDKIQSLRDFAERQMNIAKEEANESKKHLLVIQKYIENESKIRGIIDKKYSQHEMIVEIKRVISNAK
jgi:hypothetical protein